MLNIRVMEERDLQSVAKMEKDIFSDPWSIDAFADSIKNDSAIFIVAEMNDTVVGFCGVYIMSPEAEIANIAVAKDYRNRGIAQKMLSWQIEQLKEKQVEALFLDVRKTNTVAYRLYNKFGFENIAIRKDYYYSPKEDAIIMKLEIC